MIFLMVKKKLKIILFHSVFKFQILCYLDIFSVAFSIVNLDVEIHL